MPSSFSIARARLAGLSDPALLDEIRSHTGSDKEALSILRSLERFGSDGSIDYYEMTPKSGRPSYRTRPGVTWSVRAVRE